MDKQHIIDEIRRTARANKGVALGWRRFETETGIKYSDWYGKFWTRWGDAVREAGLQANRMGEPFADEVLLEKLINLTRQLGRVPVQGDVLMALVPQEFSARNSCDRIDQPSDQSRELSVG